MDVSKKGVENFSQFIILIVRNDSSGQPNLTIRKTYYERKILFPAVRKTIADY